MGTDSCLQDFSSSNLYLGAITALVSFLTTLFNSISLSHLVLLLFRDSSKGKNSTNLLYINLGICDLLQGMISSFSAVTLLNYRCLPKSLAWLCPISASCVEILPAMGLFITMYVLGIKCVVFYMPLRSKHFIRYKCTLGIVLGVWVCKVLYSFVRQVIHGYDYWDNFTVCIMGDYFRSYNFIFMGGLAVNLPILFTLLFTVVLILKVRQRHADRQALMRAAMQAVKKTQVTVSKFPDNFVAEVLNPLSSQCEPIILQCFTQSRPTTTSINVNAGRTRNKNRVRAHSVAYTQHPFANNPYNLPSICSSSSLRSTPTRMHNMATKSRSWNEISTSSSEPENTGRVPRPISMDSSSSGRFPRNTSMDSSSSGRFPRNTSMDSSSSGRFPRNTSMDSSSSGRFPRNISTDSIASVNSSKVSGSIVEESHLDPHVQSMTSLDTEMTGLTTSSSSLNQSGLSGSRLSVTSIDLDSECSEEIRVTSSKYRSLKNYLQRKHSLVSIASMSIPSRRPSRVSTTSARRISNTSLRLSPFSLASPERTSLLGLDRFESKSASSSFESVKSPRKQRHSVTLVSFIDGEMNVSCVADTIKKKPKLRPRTFSAHELMTRSFSCSPGRNSRKPLTKQQVRRITRIRAEDVQRQQLQSMGSNPSLLVQSFSDTTVTPQQGMITTVPTIVLATPDSYSPCYSGRSSGCGAQKITLNVIEPSIVQQVDSSVTVSKTLLNTVPNTVSNTVSNTASNTLSNAVSDTVSNRVSNAVSNTVSNTVPSNLSNTVSNAVSNTVLNTSSDTLSNTLSNAGSNTLSNTLTNTVSNTLSNTVSDTEPVNSVSFPVPVSKQYLQVGKVQSVSFPTVQQTPQSKPVQIQVPVRNPAREMARQRRLARRHGSIQNDATPEKVELLVRQSSDQTGLDRKGSDSSCVSSYKQDISDHESSPMRKHSGRMEEGEESSTTTQPLQSVDVIALKYSTLNIPSRNSFMGLRRNTVAVDNLHSIESPLRLSSSDLTYGTETERDIEAAQTFIRTHQNKQQPHIIPMWNKRSEHRSYSETKPARGTNTQFTCGEGGFDPLLRTYERKAPYFIDSSQYPDLSARSDPELCGKRKTEFRSEQSVRKDFVLLGPNLGGGFIKRNVSKSLQKRMQLRQQNSSGKSMRALKTSIFVALNITIFYSLFFYVWLVHVLHRFTSLEVETLVYALNDHMHVLGPLFFIFLPTLSSLLDPVIYFCNKSGVNLFSDQGSSRKAKSGNVSRGPRQRRVARVN